MITIRHNSKVLISCDSVETVKYFIKKKIEDTHKRVISCTGLSSAAYYDTDMINRLLVQKLKSCEKLSELNQLLEDVSDSVGRGGQIIKSCDFPSGSYQIIT
jgi:hypothetical protein